MKRFAVSLLICAFSVIMIAEISSALIIQFHSKQIQTKEEDTLNRITQLNILTTAIFAGNVCH